MFVFLPSIFFPFYFNLFLSSEKKLLRFQNTSAWGEMGNDICQDQVGVIRSHSKIDFLDEILFSGSFS